MTGDSKIPLPAAPSTYAETGNGDKDTGGQERTYNLLIV